MEIKITGKSAVVVGLLLLIALGFRMASFSDSQSPILEKKVRDVLWSTYSGNHLSLEINRIKDERDYDSVGALLEKASPEAIVIEQISRSEPLISLSSNQEVIVRVDYRFPDEIETQTEYMLFEHGSLLKSWSYRYDVSSISYYLNFF